MRPLKEVMERDYPDYFELAFLHPTKTAEDVLNELLAGKSIYESASESGVGFSMNFTTFVIHCIAKEVGVEYNELMDFCEYGKNKLYGKLKALVESKSEKCKSCNNEEKKKGFWIFGKRK